MESNLNEFEEEPRLRPTLLTVLCILSFIGSGWGIIGSIYSYSTASRTATMFSHGRIENSNDSTMQRDSAGRRWRKNQTMFGPKMMQSLSRILTPENIRRSAIGAIVSGVFTFFGALLMWRLRRNGYYLYIAGILVGLAVPFYLYGNNLIAIGMSTFTSFFGLIFIALYGLNIKSMR